MKKIYFSLIAITLVLIGGMVGLNSVNAEDYNLWVNGEQFTSEKTTINCGSGTATYDASNNTLTLNNATITKTSKISDTSVISSLWGFTYKNNLAAIISNKKININLVGNNKIEIPNVINDSFLMGVYTGSNQVVMEGTGFLKISLASEQGYKRWSFGIFSLTSTKFIGGTVEIIYTDVSMLNNVDLSDYSTANFVSSYYTGHDGTYATSITTEEFNSKEELHGYSKVGIFEVYKITGETTPSGLLRVQKDAIEGKTVFIDSESLNYAPSSAKVFDLSGKDVSSEVGLSYYESWGNYKFTMPNYDVKLVVTYKERYIGYGEKPTAKLLNYNKVKLTWKDEEVGGYYMIYYKKMSDKKYTFFTKTNKLSCTISNLTPGVKYKFKVVPYVIDEITHKEIKAYYGGETTKIWTLKKMSKPKVKKASKKKVQITLKKESGITGYQIAISKKKQKGYKVVKTVDNYTTKVKVKAKKGKKLYYKVRAYKKEGKKKIYAPWSNAKAYKLK